VTHRGVLDGVMSLYNGPVTQRARQLFRKSKPTTDTFPEPCQSCTCFERHHGAALKKPTATAAFEAENMDVAISMGPQPQMRKVELKILTSVGSSHAHVGENDDEMVSR